MVNNTRHHTHACQWKAAFLLDCAAVPLSDSFFQFYVDCGLHQSWLMSFIKNVGLCDFLNQFPCFEYRQYGFMVAVGQLSRRPTPDGFMVDVGLNCWSTSHVSFVNDVDLLCNSSHVSFMSVVGWFVVGGRVQRIDRQCCGKSRLGRGSQLQETEWRFFKYECLVECIPFCLSFSQ